jgi:8-oxo-dGTP pyrophosphatase MutT (NUDIX family)
MGECEKALPTQASPRAAVLIPIYRDEGGALRLVLIRRAPHGSHGGQIALPGGRCDEEDEGPVATALREAREEIGLDPANVDVLERLPEIEARASGFVVVPILGRIRRPDRWVPDPREVDEILEVSIPELARPESRGEALDLLAGWTPPRPLPFMRVNGHRLWGTTYRILEPLIPRVIAGEWNL